MLDLKDMHQYQKNIANFIIKHNGSFIIAEMGLGKTVPTLTAVNYLQKNRGIGTAIVLAPLRVVYNSWPNEITKWSHLQDVRYHILHGDGKKAVYKSTFPGNVDFVLTNFENIAFLEKYKIHKKCDVLIIDESSMIKNSKTKRFKMLKKWVGCFSKTILLTGTPSPSGELTELFSQTFMLDGGKRLGPSFWAFQQKYYQKADFMGYTWSLRDGARETITEKMEDITITLKSEDWLKLPPVIHNKIEITLPQKVRAIYDEMEKEFIIELNKDTITAANAAVKSAKLRQITSGGIYHEGGKDYTLLHESKVDALCEIIDGTDDNVLCCFQFKFERTILQRRIPGAVFIDGSTSAVESNINIDAWNSGKVKVMCCHPQSVGHGLNLQSGGHTLVWLSPDWSLERTQQMNARLARQGQKGKVFIHQVVAAGTVEEAVVTALQGKDRGQRSLVDALKVYGLNRAK